MEFCILDKEKLKLFDKEEYNRLVNALESKDFESYETSFAALVKVEETIDAHVELVLCMVDVPTAEDLTAEGGLFANDKGGKYTSWTVFSKVQYNAFKARYPDRIKISFVYQWYQKIASVVWKLVGKEAQGRWKIVADAIRKMEKNKEDKKHVKIKSSAADVCYCPLCCHAGSFQNVQKHLCAVHFPDYKTKDIQRQHIDKLNSDLAVNPKLVVVYNQEFITFWQSLFADETEKSQELNEEISLCEQLIKEAMNADGNKGFIYNQIQEKEERFACNPNSLTEVLKYVEKTADSYNLRYFTGHPINGRVGQEHVKAIKENAKVYFWTSLADIPISSYVAFEHCLIVALFHLDYGKNLAWNTGLTSIPANQKFKSHIGHLREADENVIWRNLDPKFLVKIGLVLWRTIFQNFQKAVANRSLFASKELLEYYNNLGTEGKTDYTKKCGEKRETNGLSRYATKRKRPATEESTEALETEMRALTQLNQANQFVRDQISEIDPNDTFTSQQMRDLLSTISGLTQLPQ